jgi:methionyl-tRNA formyltransferase
VSFIVATSRSWSNILASKLEARLGKPFYLLTQRADLSRKRLAEINPRYIFFPHWSHIIPEEIHKNHECIVFHMTDLPYGRGGSPLQNLILHGKKQTQISALRCINELDAGPIYLKRPLDLQGSANDIFLRAAGVIESMIEDIVRNEPQPQPQRGEVVVFRRRKPGESNLFDAKISCLNDFYDFIRMLDGEGYPKAFIDLHSHRIEFSGVTVADNKLAGSFLIHDKDNFQLSNE